MCRAGVPEEVGLTTLLHPLTKRGYPAVIVVTSTLSPEQGPNVQPRTSHLQFRPGRGALPGDRRKERVGLRQRVRFGKQLQIGSQGCVRGSTLAEPKLGNTPQVEGKRPGNADIEGLTEILPGFGGNAWRNGAAPSEKRVGHLTTAIAFEATTKIIQATLELTPLTQALRSLADAFEEHCLDEGGHDTRDGAGVGGGCLQNIQRLIGPIGPGE